MRKQSSSKEASPLLLSLSTWRLTLTALMIATVGKCFSFTFMAMFTFTFVFRHGMVCLYFKFLSTNSCITYSLHKVKAEAAEERGVG